MALFAFAERAPRVDLVPSELTAPTAAVAGESVDLEWTVTNFGSDPAAGPWYDEFRLQRDEANVNGIISETEASQIVGGVSVGEGVLLLPGESIELTTSLRLPATLPGDYRWVINTNRRGDVLEAEGRFNNELVGESNFSVALPELIVDAAAVDGRYTGPDESEWYQVFVPAGENVGVDVTMKTNGNVDLSTVANELYAARNAIPDRVTFQTQQNERGEANVSLSIEPSSVDSFVYLALFPSTFDALIDEYSIRAFTLPASIDSVSPAQVGNDGPVTITVTGERLSAGLDFRLVGEDSSVLLPAQIQQSSSNEVVLTFDFDFVSSGTYRLDAIRDDIVISELADAILIERNRTEEIQIDLLGSSRVRSGRTVAYTVNYRNPSNVDRYLPFITVQVSGGGTLRPSIGSTEGEQLVMLAPPVVMGSSMLPAGAQGQLRFYLDVPLDEGEFEINVWSDSIDNPEFASTPLPWDQYAVSLRPDTAEDAGWNRFVTEERARYGENFESLFGFLQNQISDFGSDGFADILFVNGQWQFNIPELPPGPLTFRSFVEDDGVDTSSEITALISNDVSLQSAGEGESNGDGVQNVYAVIAGNPTLDLPGSSQDANAYNHFFTKTLNIPGAGEDNPRVLVSGNVGDSNDGSAEAFLNNLKTASSAADDDDLVYVVYSGHGNGCRINDDGSLDPRSGSLRFSDRALTAGELQNNLPGSTRTVAIFDSCYSGALTSMLSGPNLTTVASTDFNQAAADGISFSGELLNVLSKNTDVGLVNAVQTASDAQQQKIATQFKIRRSELQKYEAFRKFLRGDTVVRNESIETVLARANMAINGPVGIDANSDGITDAFSIDLNADEKPEAVIPDYDGDQSLSKSDFATSQPGQQQASFDPELMTPAQQEHFRVFEQLEDARSGSRSYKSRAALQEPVVSGPTDVSINQVDSKGSGGGTTTISQDQTKETPKRTFRGERGRSFDPNEKVGPAGFGEQGFLQNGLQMPFTIFFENDPEKATLPAQEVFITEVLDEDLDLTTFQLGDIFVGDRFIEVPANRTAWSTSILLEESDLQLELTIDAELDFPSRTVRWAFATIDTETGLLTTDFDAGFLPVNDETGRGEGQVNYSVKAKASLPTGTELSGNAEIVFDVNDPLITNSTLNTIDVDGPVSTID
ncbi:MAG: caspase family protein, partial [Planctomycetota bacterium]